MEFCLFYAGGAARLASVALTLAWTHSVQKTRWEEDWRLTAAGLVLEEARIESSGAGMEPGTNARFDGHWWRWKPDLPAQSEIQLRRAGVTSDWSVCTAGTCRLMSRTRPRRRRPGYAAPLPIAHANGETAAPGIPLTVASAPRARGSGNRNARPASRRRKRSATIRDDNCENRVSP